MKYIHRYKSLLTGKKNLDHLHTFKNFPVFMGCTDALKEEDLFADMEWKICRDTGIIQLAKLLPLETLYLNQHNDGTGQIWQDHYLAFAKFLTKFKPKKILEIGGAHDCIAKYFLEVNPSASWIIVEPNSQLISDNRVKLIKSWFDDTFNLNEPIDTVVHSHVLEHTYNPVAFIKDISKFLKEGERHIFTFPNLFPMLEKKFTNCLNFEHTVFLTEIFTDYLLKKNGFRILEKKYFKDHSIFYASEKISNLDKTDLTTPNKYYKHKELFLNFIKYHEKLVNHLNSKMERFNGNIYLFGAHIFSQYLLEFGLNIDRIKNILDNSELKNKKRLYGTTLIVRKPDIIKNDTKPLVIVKVGAYRDEIIKQLKEINSRVVILE